MCILIEVVYVCASQKIDFSEYGSCSLGVLVLMSGLHGYCMVVAESGYCVALRGEEWSKYS